MFRDVAQDDRITLAAAMRTLRANPEKADSILRDLATCGYLALESLTPVPTWRLTRLGRRLRLEHFSPDLNWATVQEKITEVLDRVRRINAESNHFFRVVEVRLFGSALTPDLPACGDVDLEVKLSRRDLDPEEETRIRQHLAPRVSETLSRTYRYRHPEIDLDWLDLRRRLRNRDPALSIFFDFGQIEILGAGFAVIHRHDMDRDRETTDLPARTPARTQETPTPLPTYTRPPRDLPADDHPLTRKTITVSDTWHLCLTPPSADPGAVALAKGILCQSVWTNPDLSAKTLFETALRISPALARLPQTLRLERRRAFFGRPASYTGHVPYHHRCWLAAELGPGRIDGSLIPEPVFGDTLTPRDAGAAFLVFEALYRLYGDLLPGPAVAYRLDLDTANLPAQLPSIAPLQRALRRAVRATGRAGRLTWAPESGCNVGEIADAARLATHADAFCAAIPGLVRLEMHDAPS